MGLSPEVFWRMTPWQFKCCVEAYNKKMKGEFHINYNYAMITAWWSAKLTRAKNMPSLQDVLYSKKAVKKKASKTIDETAIMSMLKQYQKRKPNGRNSKIIG